MNDNAVSDFDAGIMETGLNHEQEQSKDTSVTTLVSSIDREFLNIKNKIFNDYENDQENGENVSVHRTMYVNSSPVGNVDDTEKHRKVVTVIKEINLSQPDASLENVDNRRHVHSPTKTNYRTELTFATSDSEADNKFNIEYGAKERNVEDSDETDRQKRQLIFSEFSPKLTGEKKVFVKFDNFVDRKNLNSPKEEFKRVELTNAVSPERHSMENHFGLSSGRYDVTGLERFEENIAVPKLTSVKNTVENSANVPDDLLNGDFNPEFSNKSAKQITVNPKSISTEGVFILNSTDEEIVPSIDRLIEGNVTDDLNRKLTTGMSTFKPDVNASSANVSSFASYTTTVKNIDDSDGRRIITSRDRNYDDDKRIISASNSIEDIGEEKITSTIRTSEAVTDDDARHRETELAHSVKDVNHFKDNEEVNRKSTTTTTEKMINDRRELVYTTLKDVVDEQTADHRSDGLVSRRNDHDNRSGGLVSRRNDHDNRSGGLVSRCNDNQSEDDGNLKFKDIINDFENNRDKLKQADEMKNKVIVENDHNDKSSRRTVRYSKPDDNTTVEVTIIDNYRINANNNNNDNKAQVKEANEISFTTNVINNGLENTAETSNSKFGHTVDVNCPHQSEYHPTTSRLDRELSVSSITLTVEDEIKGSNKQIKLLGNELKDKSSTKIGVDNLAFESDDKHIKTYATTNGSSTVHHCTDNNNGSYLNNVNNNNNRRHNTGHLDGKTNVKVASDAQEPQKIKSDDSDSRTTEEMAEAVNLELINMGTIANGVNGVSGIPLKNQSTLVNVSPYDEYFIPVNEHKKYMRGEKLYVTKDKRDLTNSKKNCCVWIIGLVILFIAVLLAIFIAVKLNQDSDDEHHHHHARPTKDILSGSIIDHSIYGDTGGGIEVISTPAPSNDSIINNGPLPTTNLTPLYLSRALEGELVLEDLKYTPDLADHSSQMFNYLASAIELELKNALFDFQTLNYGAANIYVKVISVNPESIVHYRIGWTFKDGINNPPDPIDENKLKERFKTYLETHDDILSSYKVPAERLQAQKMIDECKLNNGLCSHDCFFGYNNTLDFQCACPIGMYIDETGYSCQNETKEDNFYYESTITSKSDTHHNYFTSQKTDVTDPKIEHNHPTKFNFGYPDEITKNNDNGWVHPTFEENNQKSTSSQVTENKEKTYTTQLPNNTGPIDTTSSLDSNNNVVFKPFNKKDQDLRTDKSLKSTTEDDNNDNLHENNPNNTNEDTNLRDDKLGNEDSLNNKEYNTNENKQNNQTSITDIDASTMSMKQNDPNTNLPNIDSKLSVPNMESDIGGSITNINLSLPHIKSFKPDLDGKIEGSLQKPDMKIPDIDIKIPNIKPDIEGKVEGSLPTGDIKVQDDTLSNIDHKISAPDLTFDIEKSTSSSNLHLPHFKLSKPDFDEKIERTLNVPDTKITNLDTKITNIQPENESKVEGSLPTGDVKLPDINLPNIDPKINAPDFKFDIEKSTPSGSLDLPHFKLSKPDIDGKINGLLHIPDEKIPDIDIKIPNVKPGIEGKVEGSLPTGDVKLPEINLPDINPKINAPDFKFDIEKSAPSGNLHLPHFKLSKPDIDGKIEGSLHIPDEKIPDIDIKIPNIKPEIEGKVDGSLPTGDLKLPDINFKNIDPKISAPDFKFDIEKSAPSGNLHLPHFKLSKPDIDGKIEGSLHIPDEKIPDIDIKIPNIKPEIKSKVEGSLPTGDIKLPDINLPNNDPKINAPDFKFDIEKSTPSGSLDLPHFKLSKPDIDGKINGLLHIPDEKIPDIDIKIPNIKPGIEGKVEESLPTGDVKLPEINLPDINPKINAPDFKFDIEKSIPSGSLDLPHFKLSKPDIDGKIEGSLHIPDEKIPDIDIKIPNIKPEIKSKVEGSLPTGDIKLPDINLPNIDPKINAPDFKFDIEKSTPSGSLDLPHFKLSKPDIDGKINGLLHIPDEKIPDIDIKIPNIKPGIEGKVEGSLPTGDVKLPEINLPNINPKINAPDFKFDIEKSAPSGNLHLPHFKLSKPDIDGKIEGSLHIPDEKIPDIDIKIPNIKPEIEGKVDGSLPTGDLKLPDINLKNIDPKISAPDFKFDIEKSTPSGNLHLPLFKLSKPDLDGKIEGSLHIPDMKIPDIDIKIPNIKPEIEGKVEGSLPTGDVKLPDINLPNIDPKINAPDFKFDIEKSTPSGSLDLPHFKLSKPDIDGKINGSLHIPDEKIPDIDIKIPNIKPEIEGKVDGSLPTGDLKLPDINLKNIDPKISAPDFKFDIEKSTPSGNLHLPLFKLSKPDLDGKIEGSLHIPDEKIPDIDIKIPNIKPEIEGKVDGSLPTGDLKLPDINLKNIDSKISPPDFKFDIEKSAPSGNLHLPLFKLSKPDLDGKIEGSLHIPDKKIPDIDIKIPNIKPEIEGKVEGSLPTGDLKLPDINLPNIDPKINAPDFKFDIEKSTPSGSLDLPHFKLSKPDIDGKINGLLHIPDEKIPDIDIKIPNVKPGIEGKVEGSLPTGDAKLPEINLPDINPKINAPDFKFDIEKSAPRGNLHLPHFKLSKPDIDGKIEGSLHIPDEKIPDIDIKIPNMKPEIEGKVDGSLPTGDLKLPDINLKNIDSKISPPDFKFDIEKSAPSGNLHLPLFKLSKPDLDGKIEGSLHIPDKKIPDIDIKIPNIKPEIEGKVEGSLPTGDLKLPDINLPNIDPKISAPDFKFDIEKSTPSVGLHLPNFKLSKPDIDGKIEGSLQKPDMKIPDVDIKIPNIKSGIEGKVEGSLPTGDLKLPDINLPNIDPKISAPDFKFDIEKSTPSGGLHLPHFKLSKPDIDGKITGLLHIPDKKIPDIDIKIPNINPEIEGKVEGSLPTGDLKLPDINLPNIDPKISAPDFKFDIEKSTPSDSLHLPHFKLSKPDIDGKINGLLHIPDEKVPDIDIKIPNINPEFGGKVEGSLPTGDIKLPDINLPYIDPKISAPDFKFDIEKSKPSDSLHLPHFKLSKPDVDGKIEGSLHIPDKKIPDIDIKIPNIKPEIEGKVEGSLPTGDIKLPDINLPNIDPKINAPDFKFDIEKSTPSGSLHLPLFKLSKPNLDGKIEGSLHIPDIDIKIPNLKPKLDGKVEGTLASGDIKPPDINLPNNDPKLMSPNMKFVTDRSLLKEDIHLQDFKLSKHDIDSKIDGTLHIPSKGVPGLDINISDVKPELEGKVKGSLPSLEMRNSLSNPKVQYSKNFNSPGAFDSLNEKKNNVLNFQNNDTTDSDFIFAGVKKPIPSEIYPLNNSPVSILSRHNNDQIFDDEYDNPPLGKQETDILKKRFTHSDIFSRSQFGHSSYSASNQHARRPEISPLSKLVKVVHKSVSNGKTAY